MRGIFFDEDDARAAATRLRADGYAARVDRERLMGEDDDEDHPWAVVTDAPEVALDLLVEQYDGWLDVDEAAPAAAPRVRRPAIRRTGPRAARARSRGRR